MHYIIIIINIIIIIIIIIIISIKKMIDIAIRGTYYIFCYRNWDSPDLIQCCCIFFFFFFFNNPLSSSICKLPIPMYMYIPKQT